MPGEGDVARVESSRKGQARVMRLNMLPMALIFLVILGPVAAFIVLSGGFTPALLVLVLPLLLVLMLESTARGVERRAPASITVTDRRAIVYNPRDDSSAAMGLENLGSVEILQGSFGARRAGVSWVYLLPTGTPTAIVGRGRARRAAPGVIWIPAVPNDQANALKSTLLARARDLRARLGYPAA